MNLEFFQERYPENYPANIDPDKYESVVEIFNGFVKRFADRPAFSCLGQTLTYAELDRQSAAFAAYLQNETTLQAGDRIAVQLPNILQYPIVVFGAMRAGMVVVNTNPLYTEREMEHQFNDAGAKALVVLANMADKAESVLPNTGIKHVIVTNVGDMHGTVKRVLINSVLKYVKKEVPSVNIPGALPLRKALSMGAGKSFTPVAADRNDVAVLQYTGGTTGVAKGAMLTHRNLISNMMQCHGLFNMILDEGKESVIAPLPLYHIYAFTVHCMVMLQTGNHSILIPNPRDIPGFIKTLQTNEFSGFVGLNTLFVALCGNESFRALDFSKLKLTISGGMALTKDAADQWKQVTGCEIAEGYGMTETSPVVSFNPPGYVKLGTIGMPVSSTACKVIDEEGTEQPIGEPGELCVQGPQVMKGYWQRPEANAESFHKDWLKTGDVAFLDEAGYLYIVDRIKDLVIRGGENIGCAEVEAALLCHEEILEASVYAVPDDRLGEEVGATIYCRSPLDESALRDFLAVQMARFKIPRYISISENPLPRIASGKIDKRQLRAEIVNNLGIA